MSIARFVLPCGLALVMGGVLGSADALAGPGGGHGGRAKAVEACKDKSEGQSCTIEGRNGNKGKGTCTDTPRGKLVCLTPEMKKRHEQARARAKEACEGKASGASCSFSVGPRTIEGSCFDAPQGRLCRPEGGPGGPR